MRHLLSVLAAILTLTLATALPAQAARCEAAGFVNAAAQAYDRAAVSGSAEAFAAAADRYSDIRAIGLFALGRYRENLPRAQEAEYVHLTGRFIGGILKEYGGGFKGGDLQILDCKSSAGDLLVTTRATNGSKIVFRLARRDGGFTVKDVNMRGVWLAQQMRATFVSTIDRRGSIEGLLSWLRS